MTQNESIYARLREGWLSPADALRDHGCMRLAARVYDLRQAGHTIEERTVTGPDGKRWSEYRIVAWMQEPVRLHPPAAKTGVVDLLFPNPPRTAQEVA